MRINIRHPPCCRDITKSLGEPGHNSLNSGRATVAGWGKTENYTDEIIGIVKSAIQQKLNMPIMSYAKCLELFKSIVRFNLSGEIR